MEKIKGVSFEVRLDGRPCEVGEDGLITGNPAVKSKFALKLRVDHDKDIMVAQIGRPNSKVKDVRVWTPRIGDSNAVRYELEVEVKYSSKFGCLVTHHPVNYVAVIVLDRTGNFQFHEAAIVSQGGSFFLTVQHKYSGQLEQYRGGAVCQEFTKWPELNAALAKRHQVKKYDLPQSVTKPTKPEPKELTPGMAEVLFWDAAKGFGAVRVWDGRSARVFVNEVAPRPHLRSLTAGEVVTFASIAELPAGQGGFSCDVVGVKPLSR